MQEARAAERALEYDIPRKGFSAWVRRKLGIRPSMVLTVCVDHSGKVTDTPLIIVN